MARRGRKPNLKAYRRSRATTAEGRHLEGHVGPTPETQLRRFQATGGAPAELSASAHGMLYAWGHISKDSMEAGEFLAKKAWKAGIAGHARARDYRKFLPGRHAGKRFDVPQEWRDEYYALTAELERRVDRYWMARIVSICVFNEGPCWTCRRSLSDMAKWELSFLNRAFEELSDIVFGNLRSGRSREQAQRLRAC